MNIKQLRIIQSNFLHELQDAQDGKKTSLPFIVHEIPSSSLVKEGELFEVLVIGGSIWKKAILQKTKTGIGIIKKETERSVDFKNEKDFLEFIDNEAKDNIQVLALNFAYPLKPIFKNGRLDGKLLAVSKERSFHGLIGKKIGFEIEKYILEKRKKSREAGSRFARKIIVSLANDTICLLLSGLIKYSFDSLAAGIVGTGLNFAFFLNKNRLVNLESANFDKFPKTAEGQIIDKESNNPHGWVFEKETAGAYLYKHFNILIKDRKIDYPAISSTEELNRISLGQGYSSSEVSPKADESRSLIDDSSRLTSFARTITNPEASQIARALLKRSAQLVACQIAGVVEFKNPSPSPSPLEGEGRDEEVGMVFNMEGSLFWKGNNYKTIVQETLKQLVPKYNVRFVEIKDSGILGAAKLVS